MSVGGQTRARIEFSRIFADIFPDKKVIIVTERKDLPKNASVQRHDQNISPRVQLCCVTNEI
jgi:ethanolamine utilization protein EutP (predicted NTPase)